MHQRASAPDIVSPPASCVGVFDSGVGGLTVLSALRRRLPHTRLLYAADSAYAPYGERDASYVIERSKHLAQFLLSQGAQAIVVACNTATALAIAELRRQWPLIPFIGIEPAIKPALAASTDKPVGVLATPATLSSAKFQALVQSLNPPGNLLLQPCPGLAEAIETLGPDAPETRGLIARFCTPLREATCSTVVLGCTHYPLVAEAVREALGAAGTGACLLDPADAVAAQTGRIVASLQPLTARHDTKQAPELTAWTNGQPALLQRVAAACGLDSMPVRTLPAMLE